MQVAAIDDAKRVGQLRLEHVGAVYVGISTIEKCIYVMWSDFKNGVILRHRVS